MANKSIKELPKATQIQEDDALPMQQGTVTKQVTGLTLTLWLLGMADGHGGVKDFQKLSESGLEKTYQFLMADGTKYQFTVTDGNGIADFQHSVSGLVHTYKFIMDDGTQYSFSVKDGEKGEKGDNAYVHFRFASEKPTSSGSSMGTEPDDWIGFYSGNKSEAPTDPMEYTWAPFKGEKGNTGDPATIETNKTEYQVSDSGKIVPSGVWSTEIPSVPPGKYLWSRTITQFNTGTPNYAYSISRFGIDGAGSVVTVNNVSPDENGNVNLTPDLLGVLGLNGGKMEGTLNMNGQKLTGLNDPTDDTDAVRKSYADALARAAAPVNLLDNSDFTNPVAQAGIGGKHGNQTYAVDRWVLTNGTCNKASSVPGLYLNGTIGQKLEHVPSGSTSAFVETTSGTAQISLSDGWVYISSSGGVIANAALYEGTYDDATKPKYRPKGYGAELAECLRYCQIISAAAGYRAFTVSANTVQASIPLQTPMRAAPSVAAYNCEVRNLQGIGQTGFSFSRANSGNGFVRFTATKSGHGLQDAAIAFTDDTILSADL